MSQMVTTDTTTNSDGDNMPDIQTLTSQVQELERVYGWWSNLSLWLVAATAIVATAYFVSSWITTRRGNELKNAQTALLETKDKQLAGDLKSKDELISAANARASAADERAGEANQRAGELEFRAQELEGQNLQIRSGVANLETEAADARAEQQRIQTELARQQERAANAERELEETKNRITSVVRSTAPQWAKLVMHMEESERVLQSSPKGKVDIVYREDSVNGFRLGTEIGISLGGAGWTLISSDPRGDTFTTKFGPRPVPSVMEFLPELAKLNWSDVVVLSRHGLQQDPFEIPKRPEAALFRFLLSSEVPTYITKDLTLPEDTIRLVITVP